MLRLNLIACGRETAEGLRDPRTKTRPHLSVDSNDGSEDGKVRRGQGADMRHTSLTPAVGATMVHDLDEFAANTSIDGLHKPEAHVS